MRGYLFGSLCWALAATAALAQRPETVASDHGISSDERIRAVEPLLKRSVSLHLTRMPLAQAIDAAAVSAGLRIEYRDEALSDTKKFVTLAVSRVSLGHVLAQMLSGTPLHVVAMPGAHLAIGVAGGEGVVIDGAATNSDIYGRVVDSASGKPLPGAIVATTTGAKIETTTRDDGSFTLTGVPAGTYVLSIRCIGYQRRSMAVTANGHDNVSIAIQLPAAVTVLSGVVTTATGKQQRIQMGNDITVLNADSIRQSAPIATLTDLLESRVPGLTVLHTSGIPGAPSRLRLRGVSSPNANNDPILIVDGIRVNANVSGDNLGGQKGVNTVQGRVDPTQNGGVVGQGGYAGPSPFDQIDPASIETIEVFKGPSASAMYGSDAANGVIVVTTKRGKAGKTHISGDVEFGTSTEPGEWPINYFAFAQGPLNNVGSPGGLCVRGLSCYPDRANPDSVLLFQALNEPTLSVFGRGSHQTASANVSGGSSAMMYSVTGAASDAIGILRLPGVEAQRFDSIHGFEPPGWMRRPDRYRTWSGSSGFDLQTSGSGTVSLTNQLFYSRQQQSSLQSAVSALQGMYFDLQHLNTQIGAAPLVPEYYERAIQQSLTFRTAIGYNGTLWSRIPLRATAGLDIAAVDGSVLTPRGYVLQGSPDSVGRYGMNHSATTTRTFDVGTTLRFLDRLTTPIGLNIVTTSQNTYAAFTTGLPLGVEIPTQFQYSNGLGPAQSTVATSTYGWYVAPSININSRFFVNPGFRLDGGSTAGNHAGLLALPKLDFSWIAVDRAGEAPLLGFLTALRPRVAFGVAGVQPGPANKLRLVQYLSTTYPGGTIPIDAAAITALGNTQLRAERSREFEGGFNADLWGQRVTVSVTGARKMRYDAILSVPVAPSIGFTDVSVFRNIGTVRHSGIEATMTARVLDARKIVWDVNANVSKQSDRVVTLLPGQPVVDVASSLGSFSRLQAGYPLYGIFARPIASYADVNGNGVIEPGEVRVADSAVYMGSPEANYQLDFGTTFSLWNGRFTVSANGDYRDGWTQTNLGALGNSTLITGNNAFLSAMNDPNTPLSQQAAIVAYLTGNTAYGAIQTVNTLRWQSLSITYIVPPELSRRVHVPTARLSLQGSNLALHTNYRGKDPNVNAFASGNNVADTGQLPEPRTWTIRLQLGN